MIFITIFLLGNMVPITYTGATAARSIAVAVGDSPVFKCPLFDAIAWMKGTDILYVKEKYVSKQPIKHKYGLIVVNTGSSDSSEDLGKKHYNQYHLNIKRTDLSDADIYQCQSSEGKKVSTVLNVIERPKCNPERLPSPLKEGDKLFFSCSVRSSGPKSPVLYWTKGPFSDLGLLKMPDSKNDRTGVGQPKFRTVSNQYQLKATYEDNGLNLSCSASHSDWTQSGDTNDKMTCFVGTLNIIFNPKIICDEEQMFQPDAKEFYVYCDVLANPWTQVEQYTWRIFLNDSSHGLKPQHHPNFTVKEYYLVRESGIRTRVHIIPREVARDGLKFLLQVFSTKGNMEKMIILRIPNEFPLLWAVIGGGLGVALGFLVCFVCCLCCRKSSNDDFDSKSEKEFYSGETEQDGRNAYGLQPLSDKNSKRGRNAHWDNEHSARLARDSRKIVLTHPIEVESDQTSVALHDTPPNVKQHKRIKSKQHVDNNNKSLSRALIHADDRKSTTCDAGHTPRNDRKRRERRHKDAGGGLGSQERRSMETLDIDEPDSLELALDQSLEFRKRSSHRGIETRGAPPPPPPRPRSMLDTSGLSSMNSPSSHSHDSLLKLNMESVQEELKKKLTSPNEAPKSLDDTTYAPTTLIPPPLIVDAEITPTPHDIIAPTPVHRSLGSTSIPCHTGDESHEMPNQKYRLVDKYFPPPKPDLLDTPASKTSYETSPPSKHPLYNVPPSSAFTPVPNFSSSTSSPMKKLASSRNYAPKGPAPPIPHHKSAFHPPLSLGYQGDHPEHPTPTPVSFSPQMSISSGYASKAGSYQSEC